MSRLHKASGVAVLLLLLAMVSWRLITRDPRVKVTTKEVVSAGEAKVIKRLIRRAREVVAQEARADRLAKRDAHAQPHGCVTAQLSVREDLPPRLRRGVFETPGKTYDAWVRFSNGTQRDDRNADARGMAIKLLGVEGEKLLADERLEPTQDFVMINHPRFFVRDVRDFEPFFEAQVQAATIPLDAPLRSRRQLLIQAAYFIGHGKLRELSIASASTRHQVATPLAASYFSMVPFKYGEHNIKYSAAPCPGSRHLEVKMPQHPGPHFLRQALVEGLRPTKQALFEGDDPPAACFELRVQLQDPSKNMPIEDATIEWRQEDSPFVPVATLAIAAQTFNTEAQNRFCENLSFTPWHALPAHRPIGSLNRARREVYAAVSRFRHEYNKQPRHEPRGLCLRLDGKPCEPALARGEVSPPEGTRP